MNDLQEPHNKRETLERTDLFRCAMLGGFYTAIGAFPTAAFVALVFRFPVPFAGNRDTNLLRRRSGTTMRRWPRLEVVSKTGFETTSNSTSDLLFSEKLPQT